SLLDPERVSIVYTGRFGSAGRDPRPLIDALALLASENPVDAARLELVVAGPLTQAERELMNRDVAPARITVIGSLERDRALALQRAADALLLIAQPVRTQLANFKLYEYLHAGPPVLALAARTEAGTIAAGVGGPAVPAGDVPAIAAALGKAARGELSATSAGARSEFAYPAVAERMEAAVEQAIARREA
ncbi:MAG: hypothetical protein M3Y34_01620, partial [Actinomycetota bacterium]|nr:hypothetical protein [Actinomycetota bacterium]